MNKFLTPAVLCLLFLGATGIDTAAQAPGAPAGEIPQPPFVAKLPKFARYQVQIKRMEGGGERAPGGKNEMVRLDITKLDDCKGVVETFGDGRTKEFWIRGGLVLLKFAGRSDPLIMHPENVQIETPATNNDFSGFEWLSRRNFSGTGTFEGKKCYIFESEGTRALIDVTTKLPVLLKEGELVNHFEYPQPPVDNTKWPAEYEAKWEMMQSTVKALTPRDGPR